jgi:uncharacterized membrane protein YkoI
MKNITGIAILTSTMFFPFNNALASHEALPADQVISAIQTAVAAYPGNIHEAEVEKEQGNLIVEVKIIDADGKKIKVKVDPAKNTVLTN